MNYSDLQKPIITIVRDPNNPLGKQFEVGPDGKISKKSAVSLSFGFAVQHQVRTHDELSQLLNEVGDDPHAALINASFPDIPIGEEFAILSEREIEDRLGIPASDRDRQKGVHQIEYAGRRLKAVGRFKENVRPSNWQLLDRDVDAHTPRQFADLSPDEWLTGLAAIIPSVDQTSYVWTPSASSRVLRDGEPVGGGNGHVWMFVEDPGDVERARQSILLRAMQAELSWTKPRYSRREPGRIIGQSPTTIIDPSVWTVGRLVFDGRPSVGPGLSVRPVAAEVHARCRSNLDTWAMVMPDDQAIRTVSRDTGVEYSVKADGQGVRIAANDLTLETEIETRDDGIKTVLQLVEHGLDKKLRCQTPFRDSASWAAFLSLNPEGMPFVHDIGTGITHWLSVAEQSALKAARAVMTVEGAVKKVQSDSAAALEDSIVEALATLKAAQPPEYQRKRAALKQANSKVSLSELDRAVKAWEKRETTAQTHHGYAKALLAALTEGPWKPVGFHGDLFTVEPDTYLWVAQPPGVLVKHVAEQHDGKENCSRSSDYRAVSAHAIALAEDKNFFEGAPIGIACPKGFYRIDGDRVTVVPLTPEHRQRVMLSITPTQQPIPLFEVFLHDTFASAVVGDEAEQISLVQEIAGAIMLGLMPRHQKAILFYEPFGRAGKGTLERILRALVPASFVTAVTPFRWNHDYHVATLAGSRLNVVGELPENESIPASAFKTVIGGDLITGRHPTHRPITFANEAAHLFMSNHLISTKDQSEAFYARWLIVDFPNSRLRSGLPIDPGLAERIIAQELPGIGYWALEGASRLVQSGNFTASAAHERLMAQWRRRTSSLAEFIYEDCELSLEYHVRRSEFYAAYTRWCSDTGRRPFSKSNVKDLLEHNVGIGVRWAEVNGYEVFRGLRLKPDESFKPLGDRGGAAITSPDGPDPDY